MGLKHINIQKTVKYKTISRILIEIYTLKYNVYITKTFTVTEVPQCTVNLCQTHL